jgi:hypothetical protein
MNKELKRANKILGTDYTSFEGISCHEGLSEDFIKEFVGKVNWYRISEYQKLSEDFIKEFSDKVNWDCIPKYQKLSEPFIKEFSDKVDWYYISRYQKLSEPFIKEFSDKVDWYYISIYQKLSEDFIKEFSDKVYWYYISMYQKLSEDFIKEFDLKIGNNNWLYKSKEFKKEEILKTGSYELDGDYVIAYKGIRSDNYSTYNFQYQYFVGNEYERHCDCNVDNENSFGLSAWTMESANNYCDQKLIKVRIHLNDLGAIVHDGNKLRCFKFNVLEEVE